MNRITRKLVACLLLAAGISTASFAQNIQKTTDKKGNLVLEKAGKVVVKENFERVAEYNAEAGLIPAKLNGKWGFYDNDGKLAIPHQFEGLTCKIMAPPLFDGWYSQERIEISQNGRKFFIDKTGQEASAPEYELIIEAPYSNAGYFFKKGGKWALADKDKKVLTEFKYDKISLVAVNPFQYGGVINGENIRLDASGQEIGTVNIVNYGSNSSSSDSKAAPKNDTPAKKEEPKKQVQYACTRCGAAGVGEGAAPPTRDTKGVRACKSYSSHAWKKQ